MGAAATSERIRPPAKEAGDRAHLRLVDAAPTAGPGPRDRRIRSNLRRERTSLSQRPEDRSDAFQGAIVCAPGCNPALLPFTPRWQEALRFLGARGGSRPARPSHIAVASRHESRAGRGRAGSGGAGDARRRAKRRGGLRRAGREDRQLGCLGHVFIVDRVLDEHEERIRDLLGTAAAGARGGCPGGLLAWFRTGELTKIFLCFVRTRFRDGRGSPSGFWAAMTVAGELLAVQDPNHDEVTAGLEPRLSPTSPRCSKTRPVLRQGSNGRCRSA